MLAAIALFVVATSAHAQGVAGKWSATFDSDISGRGDSFVVKERRPATLELTQRGDSVFGTWTVAGMDKSDVSGTFDGKILRITTGLHEREIRINGTPSKMKVRTDWTGSVSGNALSGVMTIRIGDREPPPRKWEAAR